MKRKTEIWRLTLHEYNSLLSHGGSIPKEVKVVIIEEQEGIK